MADKVDDMSLRLCDIPSFVEVDGVISKRSKDGSDGDSYNHCENTVGDDNGAVRYSAVSTGGVTISSFVEVHDENDYYDHRQGTTVESPKIAFELSLSLQESMIDSSNVESLTVATDHNNVLDTSLDQEGANSCADTRDETTGINKQPNDYTNTSPLLHRTSSSHGHEQLNPYENLDQEEIEPSLNTDIPAVNTSALRLGRSCFVNVGKHLNETGSIGASAVPNSAQKYHPVKNQSAQDVVAAGDFISTHADTVSGDDKSSSPSTSCSALILPIFIVGLILISIDLGESEDVFETDVSVEIQTETLQEDIAAKLDYYVSRHGTEVYSLMDNINTSHGYDSVRHGVELVDFQTEEESNFEFGGLPQTIVRHFSTTALMLCLSLVLLQTFLRGKIARTVYPSKEPKLLSTPLPMKRCTRELSSLKGTPVLSSAYKHEIVLTDGSKTKVRRSARIVLSNAMESHARIKGEQHTGMSMNLTDEFEAMGNDS